jgi:copper chaperone CopZ
MAEQESPSAASADRTEELDLMIPDMDTEGAEKEVKQVLERLPGIRYVRLVQRGALVKYNPVGIGPDEICTAIRQSGFRASTFQESKTGRTGVSSQ